MTAPCCTPLSVTHRDGYRDQRHTCAARYWEVWAFEYRPPTEPRLAVVKQ